MYIVYNKLLYSLNIYYKESGCKCVRRASIDGSKWVFLLSLSSPDPMLGEYIYFVLDYVTAVYFVIE